MRHSFLMGFGFLSLLVPVFSVGAFAFTFDGDVPADIQQQMLQDLQFVATIQGNGASPLHQQIFGQVDGPTYSKFFSSRVQSVGLSGCGDSNAVACVIPMEDSSKMWITQNYIQFSHPQIARLMVIFHESRHTENQNDNWPHAMCPHDYVDANGQPMRSIWTGAPLADEPACDTTPLGSYGSSLILLKNIQNHCTNCTEKVKMDAGIYADDQFGRIIDGGAIAQMKADMPNLPAGNPAGLAPSQMRAQAQLHAQASAQTQPSFAQ